MLDANFPVRMKHNSGTGTYMWGFPKISGTILWSIS